MPSIDVSSIQPPAPSYHQKRPSSGSHDDRQRTVTKKSSKRSFGMRSKEREQPKDKELPSRPSGGTTLSTTASSASSSFFHVSSNAHTAIVEPARSGTLENLAASEESPRSQSPSKGKTLPPIPHDLVPASPQPGPASPLPTGEVDPNVFETIGASSLAVRFEINVVKVSCYNCFALSVTDTSLIDRCPGCPSTVYSSEDWAAMAGNTTCWPGECSRSSSYDKGLNAGSFFFPHMSRVSLSVLASRFSIPFDSAS